MSSVGKTRKLRKRKETSVLSALITTTEIPKHLPHTSNILQYRERTMSKSQFFLNYVPEVSPADILLMSQNIENTAKRRRLMMQGTEAVSTGR